MKGLLITLGITGLAASLPIWRGAGHSRHHGVTFWELLYDSTNELKNSPFGHPHLPYKEAVEKAREAYRERCVV